MVKRLIDSCNQLNYFSFYDKHNLININKIYWRNWTKLINSFSWKNIYFFLIFSLYVWQNVNGIFLTIFQFQKQSIKIGSLLYKISFTRLILLRAFFVLVSNSHSFFFLRPINFQSFYLQVFSLTVDNSEVKYTDIKVFAILFFKIRLF